MKRRTVVITGGTKGLGRETALAFGRAGYFVVALYSSDEDAAGRLMGAFADANISGSVLQHNVSSEDGDNIWNLPEIQDAESLTLVHNACAPFSPVPMHQLRWPDFENNLNVILKGGWLSAQALIRSMLKNGSGTIVNILTSAIEGTPPKGFSAYVAAKHALHGLTLSLAAEYSNRGVRVFSASPGFMETSLTSQWDPRLQEAIRLASPRLSNAGEAAKHLLELVESKAVPGHGEDYPV